MAAGTGRNNASLSRLLQVILLFSGQLCCLVCASVGESDGNMANNGKRNSVCDSEIEECIFNNVLNADFGDQTSLLDDEDSRQSFEVLSKVWINLQHHCDGVDDIYLGIDMERSSSRLSKGRKGKGKGKCRGRNCPKLISYAFPDRRSVVKQEAATDVCNITLLEFLQDGNPKDYGDLEEVQLNSENNAEEDLLPFACGDQCLQEREAVSALLTQCSNSDGSPVIDDVVGGEHICAWLYVTCDDELKVTRIDTDYNYAQCGTIPSEIGLLSNLEYLKLYYSALTGTIPSEIGLLSNLEYLILHYNALTGTIPSEIGLLSNLDYLHFHDNSLTGTIPSEIGLLSTLEYLDLSFNALTGTIPSEIGLLSNLEYFYLYDNALSCPLPSEVLSLDCYIYSDCGNYNIDDDWYDNDCCDCNAGIFSRIVKWL